jgi:glyoxylase-like metal-dependent hydrolase (beta-lactamase superfamily II)
VVGPPPGSWEIDVAATKAFAVADGIWRLRLPMPYAHISHANAYLLDGHVLVDCGGGGHPSAYDALQSALTDAGADPITDLVITHFHSDHMGCAARLVQETGCTVCAVRESRPPKTALAPAHPASEHFLGPHADPARYRAVRAADAERLGVTDAGLWDDFVDMREETDGIDGPVTPDHLLSEGTTIPGGWVAHETPGHAPSQVVLFHPERRILIAADLIGPVFAPYFELGPEDPVAEHKASLEVAAGLGATLALPGHGRPLEALPELFAANVRGLDERLQAVREALDGRAATPAELLDDLFPVTENRADRVWRLIELTGYLEHLRLTGVLARDGTRYRRC